MNDAETKVLLDKKADLLDELHEHVRELGVLQDHKKNWMKTTNEAIKVRQKGIEKVIVQLSAVQIESDLSLSNEEM